MAKHSYDKEFREGVIQYCLDHTDESYVSISKRFGVQLAFAYIPKKSKQIINDILREMEKNEYIRQLHEQWYLYKQDIQSTYRDEVLEKLPLLEQKEFKSIKNMILKEAVSLQTDDIFHFQEVQDIENDTQLFSIDNIGDIEVTNSQKATADTFILEHISFKNIKETGVKVE